MQKPLDKREQLAELLLAKHRVLFPTTANYGYFNYGAQGLLPTPALIAIQEYYGNLLKNAPFTLETRLADMALLKSTRAILAAELGGSPGRTAFSESTSTGCNIALWGMNWRSGDQIILSSCEYPGVVVAVRELAARHQLEVLTCPIEYEADAFLNRLDEMLTPRTRLVVLSHITWNRGIIVPLKKVSELCHSKGDARILVDGAQSVGVLPLELDEQGVDFYAFTGHKWCCGPEGMGGFYVGEQAFSLLKPTFLGWRSLKLDDLGAMDVWDDARKFETGSASTALYAGLQASLKTHHKWGNGEARFNRIRALSRAFWEALRSLAEHRSGLTCLQDKAPEAGLVFFKTADNQQLVRNLEERGLLVRTIPTEDCIRVSINYLTSRAELENLLGAIAEEIAA